MKKKILSFIITVLILVPCLCTSVFANNNDVLILNGGQGLQYKGNNYVRFNASFVLFETGKYLEDVKYDTAEIKSANYDISKNEVIITAHFNYRDGSTLTASFIDQNRYNEFLSLEKNSNTYEIEFISLEQTDVTATKDSLFGQAVTLTNTELMFCDFLNVEVQSPDQTYSILTGALLIIDDSYYYVDYKQTDISNPNDFSPGNMQSLNAYKITDPQLCEQIKENYDDTTGLGVFGTEFLGGISIVFVILFFVIIPTVLLVMFIILYKRAKTPAYKKLFSAIWITSTAELTLFAITAILLLTLK